MKLLVTGAAGQLGHDIIKEAERRGCQVTGTDLGDRWSGLQMDITDAEAVTKVIREVRPDIVYHCACFKRISENIFFNMRVVQKIISNFI